MHVLAVLMGRRLEKYYLFGNTTFLSLFTMKFVRYIYIYIYDNIHSKLEPKKACKLYRKFPIHIGNFRYIYTTKYTLSWNKKRFQNMSEIFDMVHMNQVRNLAEVSRDFRDIIS